MTSEKAAGKAYFRKMSVQRLDVSLKSALFEKTLFLNLNQKCQKQLPIRGGGMRPPTVLLDYASVLLSKKGTLSFKKEPFSKNDFIQLFILNKQFLSHICFMRHNEVYTIKSER